MTQSPHDPLPPAREHIDANETETPECQADSSGVGGPHEHSDTLYLQHVQYGDNGCYDGFVCATHFGPSVAFQINETQGQTGASRLVAITVDLPAPIGPFQVYYDPFPA